MIPDREKTQAQIEARLRQFGQTLSELKTKAEQRQEKFNGQMRRKLDDIEGKHAKARQRLRAMASLGDDEWAATETDVNRYLDDIDGGLRKALSYFK